MSETTLRITITKPSRRKTCIDLLSEAAFHAGARAILKVLGHLAERREMDELQREIAQHARGIRRLQGDSAEAPSLNSRSRPRMNRWGRRSPEETKTPLDRCALVHLA
jgi:hypothetical protein